MDVLGFDLDGVLYDWHSPVYEYVVQYMGETRDYDQFWIDAATNKKAENKMLWRNLTKDLTLYNKVQVSKHIVKMVNDLSEKYEIVYITHRDRQWTGFTTWWWLKSNGFPNYDNLEMSGRPKAKSIEMYNCKYFVDDRDYVLESIKDVTQAIGVRHPQNRHIRDIGIPFLDDILDLPALLDHFENDPYGEEEMCKCDECGKKMVCTDGYVVEELIQTLDSTDVDHRFVHKGGCP